MEPRGTANMAATIEEAATDADAVITIADYLNDILFELEHGRPVIQYVDELRTATYELAGRMKEATK